MTMLVCTAPFALRGQDTTQAYPWRLSYFPYVTAEPYNGAMLMGRAVLFQQSRWDARTSVDKQLVVEGGYSTSDSWQLRAEADLPHLAPGWRLQAVAQAGRERLAEIAAYGYAVSDYQDPWSRQSVEAEVTRTVVGPLQLAVRGGWVRATQIDEHYPELSVPQSEIRGRVALVLDLRDREYDTRKGALLQGGFILGSSSGTYRGGYGLASVWVPAGDANRLTARAGYRAYGEQSGTADAWRTIPAWEDEFTAGGGWQSNRALPPGYLAGRKVMLASAEARHELIVFPGGALSVLAFVDGGRVATQYSARVASPVAMAGNWTSGPFQDWVVGAGGGVSLRLLRNAVLTATVARAQGATQFYLQSGWSW